MSPAESPHPAPDDRARPARSAARRALALLGVLVGALAITLIVVHTLNGPGAPPRVSSASARHAPVAGAAPAPPEPAQASAAPASQQLQFRPATFNLPSATADTAPVVLDSGEALLFGGRLQDGNAVDTIQRVSVDGASRSGHLPRALQGAAAVTIAGTPYLFGGSGPDPTADVLKVDSKGRAQVVDQLPAAVADAGAAVIGGTAYIVGGFDGRRAVSTVVAWQPGVGSHIVAHLPRAVRAPAVAAVGGEVIAAGGSDRRGATRAVYGYDPSRQQAVGITALPDPLTHAAAAVLAGRLYLLGGRLSAQGTPTDRVLVYDPDTARVAVAGSLPTPLSDAAAMGVGDRIVLAGGIDESGRLHDDVQLGSTQ